jgi:hypothetical protein
LSHIFDMGRASNFGITTDPLSGSPNRHFKDILLQFYLRNHRYFCVGNSRTILPITRLADSTNIATFVGIVILSLGYQSHMQHIIWSMVHWFERISKYCASMLYWYIFLWAYFPQLFQISTFNFKWSFEISKCFIFHGELYRIVADRLQLLLEDTLYQLSHLLDGLKINLSNWLYACSQQVTEQAQTAPTSTLPPTITRHCFLGNLTEFD